MKFSMCSTFATVAGMTLSVVAATADAGIVGNAFTITATNGAGTDQFTVPASSLSWTGSSWLFETPIGWSTNLSNGVLLTAISTEYVDDPQIFFNFGASTGGVATTFSVTSATLTFPSLLNPTGYASSGITLTDNSFDGASVIGNMAGTNSYNAVYNGATSFALQQPSFGFPTANATNTQNANDLGIPVAGLVSSMQASWNFTVSADDSVGVTSTWVLIPAPGSVGLLGMGGLLVARRRR